MICPFCGIKDRFQHEGIDEAGDCWFLCLGCEKEFTIKTSDKVIDYINRFCD